MRFRSKVVEIEAVRWNGIALNLSDLHGWMHDALVGGTIQRDGEVLRITTLEGVMTASPGDWIIKGTEGELYPCKPSVFDRKYEPVEGSVR